MITCHRRHLFERCRERGYLLAAVMPCVVSRDGPMWTIDENHPAYPRRRTPRGGAGTELKKLLSLVGIRSSPTCKCNARAAEMDVRGVAWVDKNRATVVEWLREESGRRKLPFVATVARLVVARAIRNARKLGYV
jgi:hypothetical protein